MKHGGRRPAEFGAFSRPFLWCHQGQANNVRRLLHWKEGHQPFHEAPWSTITALHFYEAMRWLENYSKTAFFIRLLPPNSLAFFSCVCILQQIGRTSGDRAGTMRRRKVLIFFLFFEKKIANASLNFLKVLLVEFKFRPPRLHSKYKDLHTHHSSEVRGLCLMKCSTETLENLPYFWNTKTHIVFPHFLFCATLLFTNECIVHSLGEKKIK